MSKQKSSVNSVWVSVHELKTIICGGHTKIRRELLAHMQDMPHAIKLERQNNIPDQLLFDIRYLDDFCKLANFTKKQDVQKKTTGFKSAVDLSKVIVGGTDKIRTALSEWYYEIPECETSNVIKICGKQHSLCLNTEYLDLFVSEKHLVKKANVQEKTKCWLSEYDLKEYFIGDTRTNLHNLRHVIPYAIQVRGPQQMLCVHEAFLSEFFQNSVGLVQREKVQEKTKEWKNATQLSREYLCESEAEIYKALCKQMSVMPDAIQKRGVRQSLCLNINKLDIFVKRAKFSKKSDYPIATEKWKSAEELSKRYIPEMGIEQIRNLLKYLQPDMPAMIQIRRPEFSGRRGIYLNINYLNEFLLRVSGVQNAISFVKRAKKFHDNHR